MASVISFSKTAMACSSGLLASRGPCQPVGNNIAIITEYSSCTPRPTIHNKDHSRLIIRSQFYTVVTVKYLTSQTLIPEGYLVELGYLFRFPVSHTRYFAFTITPLFKFNTRNLHTSFRLNLEGKERFHVVSTQFP